MLLSDTSHHSSDLIDIATFLYGFTPSNHRSSFTVISVLSSHLLATMTRETDHVPSPSIPKSKDRDGSPPSAGTGRLPLPSIRKSEDRDDGSQPSATALMPTDDYHSSAEVLDHVIEGLLQMVFTLRYNTTPETAYNPLPSALDHARAKADPLSSAPDYARAAADARYHAARRVSTIATIKDTKAQEPKPNLAALSEPGLRRPKA
ncbi:hypothetical protein BDW74DRAFT_177805 [Aspergillus multicolor]|uniref:uncharacterized protein n=1 Tax=Aspergillus multicolor TaxID=41759 RepID=UPI003CCCAF35